MINITIKAQKYSDPIKYVAWAMRIKHRMERAMMRVVRIHERKLGRMIRFTEAELEPIKRDMVCILEHARDLGWIE